MKKTFYILGGVIITGIVIFFLLTFIQKVNNSGVGKYVPIGNKMILNTTNGKVYVPKKNNYGKFKWNELISFKTEKELEKEKTKIKLTREEEFKTMDDVIKNYLEKNK